MSIITSEDKISNTGFEIEGVVKSIQKSKYVWIEDLKDYRHTCDATLIDSNGNIINIKFSGDDISKIRNNLRIKITSAEWCTSKKYIFKSWGAEIIVLGFNPNEIKEDIINIKKRKKIISFKEYQRHVQNTPSSTYLGADKKQYLLITKAFAQIEKLASRFRNSAVSCAIKYLHNKITLSAEQICTILKIFNISVPCDRILRNSIPSKLKENTHTKNSYKITVKKTDSNSIHLETTIEENTEGPINTALPSEISVNEISSDSKFTPVMIEDIKYCGNFTIYGDSSC